MTEQEWLVSTDPIQMLEILSGTRVLRLFAVACCRRIWHLMTDQRSRHAVEIAERFADGEATEEERKTADDAATAAASEADARAYARVGSGLLESSAIAAAYAAANAVGPSWTFDNEQAELHYFADNPANAVRLAREETGEPSREAKKAEFAIQAALLREIFGNPFHPISLDRAWLTPTVVQLAQAAYDERILPSGHLCPTRLGIMADALEELGAVGLVEHLRRPEPHVRGCHVIDTLLG
jgi:hypothetical protein